MTIVWTVGQSNVINPIVTEPEDVYAKIVRVYVSGDNFFMKSFKKERTIIIDVDSNKFVKIDISVIRGENGELTISTKIGDEPWVNRETSIYNPNIVKEY